MNVLQSLKLNLLTKTVGTLVYLTSILETEDISKGMQQPQLVAVLEMLANLALSARTAAANMPTASNVEIHEIEHLKFHIQTIFNLLANAEQILDCLDPSKPNTVEDLIAPSNEQDTPAVNVDLKTQNIVSDEELEAALKNFFIDTKQQ